MLQKKSSLVSKFTISEIDMGEIRLEWEDHDKGLSTKLWEFCNEEFLVDFIISCHGQQKKVHKCVLVFLLPVLKDVFKSSDTLLCGQEKLAKGGSPGESANSLQCLNLDSVAHHAEDIDYLIEFVYTGKTTVPKEHADCMLQIADSMGIKSLKQSICQWHYKGKLVENPKYNHVATQCSLEPELQLEKVIQSEKTVDFVIHYTINEESTSSSSPNSITGCDTDNNERTNSPTEKETNQNGLTQKETKQNGEPQNHKNKDNHLKNKPTQKRKSTETLQILTNLNEEANIENQGTIFAENQETVFAENQETVFAENQETVFAENQETVFAENQETVFAENQETVFAENQETVFAENQETVFEENQETVFAENQETVFEENQETVFEENQETVFEENQETVFEENQETIFAENQETSEDDGDNLSKNSESSKQFTCKKCNKQIENETQYVTHCDTNCGTEFPTCKYCGHKTRRIFFLKRHIMAIHHVDMDGNPLEMNINCTKCDFVCYANYQLRIHERVKHDHPDKVKCKECSFTAPDITRMRKHELTHNNIREFMCEECGKRFQTKEVLNNHVSAIHMGLKPYMCDICGTKYKQKEAFRRHLQCHSNSEDYNKLVCDVCGYCSRKKRGLSVHKQKAHGLKLMKRKRRKQDLSVDGCCDQETVTT